MATLRIQTEETTLNKKAKEATFYNNGRVFLLCEGLSNYNSIKTANMGGKLARKDSAHCSQLRQLQSISYRFAGILYIYSSRLILLYSDHLEGRQTIENQLGHTGTSSYRCTHKITSSIFILVHFFHGFIFAEAGLSAKISTQQKFPTMW